MITASEALLLSKDMQVDSVMKFIEDSILSVCKNGSTYIILIGREWSGCLKLIEGVCGRDYLSFREVQTYLKVISRLKELGYKIDVGFDTLGLSCVDYRRGLKISWGHK